MLTGKHPGICLLTFDDLSDLAVGVDAANGAGGRVGGGVKDQSYTHRHTDKVIGCSEECSEVDFKVLGII